MKKIIHFDLDYFFAQVELLTRPELRDRPVAIGGTSMRRGVISTCNYVARKYGVRSAMPTFKALQLCPQLILLGSNFGKYDEYSRQVFKVFYQFTDKVQKVSVDEAYMDVTDTPEFDNCATLMAAEMKRRIFEQTGLTGSAGVSYNKLLAKIASEYNKPDGLFVITPQVFEKMGASLNVSKINGVGKVTEQKLKQMNINTIGDLRRFSKLDLVGMFGSFGPTLYDYCRGIDHREVKTDRLRKSLSVERTFGQDIVSVPQLTEQLKYCYGEFERRMEKHQEKSVKSCFVKIKYSDFDHTTIECASKNYDEQTFQNLFCKRYFERMEPIRLLGVGVRFHCERDNGQLQLI